MTEKRDGKEEELDCMECESGTWMEFVRTTANGEDIWKCPRCGMIHRFTWDGDVKLTQG